MNFSFPFAGPKIIVFISRISNKKEFITSDDKIKNNYLSNLIFSILSFKLIKLNKLLFLVVILNKPI